MNRRRAIVAFLLSPLVGALTFLLLWIVANGASTNDLWLPRTQIGQAVGLIFLFPLAIGFLAEIVLGLPLLKVLVALRWLSTASFTAGGFVIGLVVLLALYWGDAPGVWGVIFCTGPAVVAAVFFGAVGGWVSGRAEPQDGQRASETG